MAIIGPAQSLNAVQGYLDGWTSQFAEQSQFGSGQFLQGTNTFMPLAAMPIAQAFRYWWACKTWRIQSSIAWIVSGITENFSVDSGILPYGVGYSDTYFGGVTYPERNFCNLNGDQTMAPRLPDRYLNGGAISPNPGDEFSATNCIGNTFQNIQVVSGQPNNISVFLGLMGRRSYTNPNVLPTTPLGLVFDSSSPPRVFMCLSVHILFSGAFGTASVSTIKAIAGGSSSVISSGTLDGMAFDLYGNSGVTASLTITTAG